MTIRWKELKKDKRLWALIGALVLAVVVVKLFIPSKQSQTVMPLYKVERGPLTISVNTSGSVQSRDKVIIKSELEGNNTMLWVIDEGKTVKTGDLLIEFDSSDLQTRKKEQEVTVINARSSMEITQERLVIAKGDGEALLLDTEVAMRLAEMDMEKYVKGDLPQDLRQLESAIFISQEDLNRTKDKYEWSKKLAKEKFLTAIELQTDEIATKRAKIALDSDATKLNVYTNYTMFKERAALDSAVRKTRRAHERTRWQNSATQRQIQSELLARTREYERATNRLGEIEFQLEKSRICAPTNGIVLYATSVQISRRQWWVQPLRSGGTAVQRQELIYLPIESGMIVEAMIPEASLNKISENMQAMIKIDAIPGRVFKGQVTKIGLLPDGQSAILNPDLKLYKCEVEFVNNDAQIRSGMTCNVELIRETYEDVVAVPVQCVVRVGGKPRVYFPDGNGGILPKEVKVGMDNNRMILVTEGLVPGDKILLAPPVPDEMEHGKKKSSAGLGTSTGTVKEKKNAKPR